jgi:predicted  nucleic acid-binding Zn-ribbon protein
VEAEKSEFNLQMNFESDLVNTSAENSMNLNWEIEWNKFEEKIVELKQLYNEKQENFEELENLKNNEISDLENEIAMLKKLLADLQAQTDSNLSEMTDLVFKNSTLEENLKNTNESNAKEIFALTDEFEKLKLNLNNIVHDKKEIETDLLDEGLK